MMCKKLFCLIFLFLLLVIGVRVQAEVIFSDNFDHAMMDDWSRINYQGWYEQNVLGWPSPGGPWVIGNWDGYQSMPDDTGVSPTVLAYNYIDTFNVGMGEPNQPQAWTPGTDPNTPVLNGVLRITSTNGGWADQWNTGPFLYKMVEGDFVAQVQVVSVDYWWNVMGGLMARVPNPDGVGENENWVYLNYFPVYSVGNNIRNTINGASTEMQAPWRGYPPDPYLRIQRSSNTFFFYTSPDGETWTSLPGLEDGVVRDDMPAELQVGIFQANFTGDWQNTMDFDNFSIATVPEPTEKEILVEDDFEAETIDLSKWQLLNGPDVNITQADGQIFFDRPQTELNYLITAEQYDPAVTPLTITGSAVTGPEGMDIWTRASNIGNTADSAQHVLDSGIRITIWPEGEANAWYDAEIIEKTAGTWPWSGIVADNIPGEKVYNWNFVITDDGTTITATWTQSDDPSNTFTLTAISTTKFDTNYVAFTVINGYLNDVTISTP